MMPAKAPEPPEIVGLPIKVRVVNDNYSSLQCQLKITLVPACFVVVDGADPLGHPLGWNGVPGAVGDRDAVEPKGMAGAPGQPLPFPRETRRLSPSNSRMMA